MKLETAELARIGGHRYLISNPPILLRDLVKQFLFACHALASDEAKSENRDDFVVAIHGRVL
jgi:hypothetical protein